MSLPRVTPIRSAELPWTRIDGSTSRIIQFDAAEIISQMCDLNVWEVVCVMSRTVTIVNNGKRDITVTRVAEGTEL